jgi:hypothetical protein
MVTVLSMFDPFVAVPTAHASVPDRALTPLRAVWEVVELGFLTFAHFVPFQ